MFNTARKAAMYVDDLYNNIRLGTYVKQGWAVLGMAVPAKSPVAKVIGIVNASNLHGSFVGAAEILIGVSASLDSMNDVFEYIGSNNRITTSTRSLVTSLLKKFATFSIYPSSYVDNLTQIVRLERQGKHTEALLAADALAERVQVDMGGFLKIEKVH
jgi:hypothetical protein